VAEVAALQQIGRFEVLEELGRGAMGLVYRARDPQLDRVVAIKTVRRDLGLPPEEYAAFKQRFYQEATAAGRLSHPNLVAVHDVVEVDGVPYMVMEYVDGRTLAELIASEGPLLPDRAVPLVVQVCGALHYAHAHGVVHRDIKPGNVLVDRDGVAKVSDFGIARLPGSQVTRTGVLLGTPAYMAPEQLAGRSPDGRSDLFSLGVALYEALTGVNPFNADDLATTVARIVTEIPVPARERNPAISVALDDALGRALAKRPEDRYPTAQAFADALARALAPEAGLVTDAVPGRSRSRLVPRWVALTVIGVLCLVALGVGGLFAWDWWWQQQVGSIVVTTNPQVEVFIDGEFRGQAGEGPLVLSEIAVGERSVTLRLGAREWTASGPVRRDQPLALSHRFPEERPAQAGKTLRGMEGKVRDALDKPREVFEQFRGAIDRLWKSP
jgi:protein kinase-like protein